MVSQNWDELINNAREETGISNPITQPSQSNVGNAKATSANDRWDSMINVAREKLTANQNPTKPKPVETNTALNRQLIFGNKPSSSKLPLSVTSPEITSLFEDSVTNRYAKAELDYLNSNEFKEERQNEIANQEAALAKSDEDLIKYIPNLEEARINYELAKAKGATEEELAALNPANITNERAQIAANISALRNEDDLWYRRKELEILSAGGQTMMDNILYIAKNTYMEDKTGIPKNDRETWEPLLNRYKELYGDDKVEGWIDYAERINNQKAMEGVSKTFSDFGKEYPVLGLLSSIPMAPMKAAGYVDMLGQELGGLITGSDAPMDINTLYQMPSVASSAIRQGATEDRNAVDAFLYNTVASIGDSVFTTITTGGGNLSLSLMGLSSATDTTRMAKQRGLSDTQALGLGAIAGTMEYVTEKMDLNRFYKIKGSAGKAKYISSILKNGGIEATEEAITRLANTAADLLISGDQSELAVMIEEYKKEYDDSTARSMALKDWGVGLLLDATGGFLSGGVYSTAGVTINSFSNRGGNNPTTPTGQNDVSNVNIEEDVETAVSDDKSASQPLEDDDSLDDDITETEETEETETEPTEVSAAPNIEAPKQPTQKAIKNDELGLLIEIAEDADSKFARRMRNKLRRGEMLSSSEIRKLERLARRVDSSFEYHPSEQAAPGVDVQNITTAEEQTSNLDDDVSAALSDMKTPEQRIAEDLGGMSNPMENKTAPVNEGIDSFSPASVNPENVGDMGAKTNPFPHKVVKSQTHAIDNMEAVGNVPKEHMTEFAHDRVSERENLYNSNLRLEQDYEGEMEYLRNAEKWNGEDSDTANIILKDLMAEAMETGTEEAWDAYNEWKAIVHDHSSQFGSALQALAKWARNTGAKIVERASDALEYAKENTDKTATMNTVSAYAAEYDAAKTKNDVDSIVDIIKNTSKDRKTGSFFGNKLSKKMLNNLSRIAEKAKADVVAYNQRGRKPVQTKATNYALSVGDTVRASDRGNYGKIISVNLDGTYSVKFKSKNGAEKTKKFRDVQLRKKRKHGVTAAEYVQDHEVGKYYDFLSNIAAMSIESIATDKTDVTFGKKLSAYQRLALLSKITTPLKNLINNGILNPTDMTANNVAAVFDTLLSKITGTRSVAFENPLSKLKREAADDASAMAMISIGLDVNDDAVSGKYENTSNRTWHMSNGPVAKFMSTWEKYNAYLLVATDEKKKGSISSEVQRGIDKLYAEEKIKDDSLHNSGAEIAKYRTLQQNGYLADAATGVRNFINDISMEQTGTLGLELGTQVMPFAQVTSNVPGVMADFSPIGLAKGVGQLAKVLKQAKDGTLLAADQAKAIRSISRGLVGSGLIQLSTFLAKAGLVHIFAPGGEEEEKNKGADLKASGEKGTQWNLDATMRAIRGEDPTWKDSDTIVSIGFLEPFNAFLSIGALMADEEELGVREVLDSTASGILDAYSQTPLLQTYRDVSSSFENSKADSLGGKAVDALEQLAASTVGTLIPNAVKGVAQGTDSYQRDMYASDGFFERTRDQIFGSIPGLRQTLPIKQDVYGNDMTTGNGFMNFVNANVSPFYISEYQETDLQKALRDLERTTGSTSGYLTSKAPGSITIDGSDVKLTDDQKTQYLEDRGNTYDFASKALQGSKVFQNAPADFKQKAYDYAEDYAVQTAKENLGIGYETDGIAADLQNPTSKELLDEILQRATASLAKNQKMYDNQYHGLSEMRKNNTINDDLALATMSETRREIYEEFLKNNDVSVGTWLDVLSAAERKHGTESETKKDKDKKADAKKYIDSLDLTAKQRYFLNRAVSKIS